MKPVYKIKRKDLKAPRECYSDLLHRLMGIKSPSRCTAVMFGAYGEDVRQAYIEMYYNFIRLKVNKRKANKHEYQELRRYERKHKEG